MNSLHIELTNRCTLECPACPRTIWKNILQRPVPKKDLNIDDLENFLNCPGGRKIEHFTLCGDYGDAIYYPYLFEFLERFRSNKTYTLVTNGSYKNEEFWKQLASILTSKDKVIFSIDGLEDTNHLYRKNSNWSSIMTGLDIMCNNKVSVTWKTIIFSTNLAQLSDIKNLAQSKGAIFTAEKTHRFGDESLRPSGTWIEENHLFQTEYTTRHDIEIVPKCEKERTVTCDGYLFPCDWIRNPHTLYKSQLWKQKNRWLDHLAINQTNYDSAMGVVQDWSQYVRQSSLDQAPTVDVLCRMKCRVGCDRDKYVEVS